MDNIAVNRDILKSVENRPDVSILMSVRPGLPGIAVDSIRTAYDLSTYKTRFVEWMLKVDHNDFKSQQVISDLISELKLNAKIIIADGLAGRYGIAGYTNLLAWNSTGKLLWYWSDELRLQTRAWDALIKPWAKKYEKKIVMLYPMSFEHPGHPFGFAPVISRRWLEETGRFAYHLAIDTYLDLVSGPLRAKKLIVPFIMNNILAKEITLQEAITHTRYTTEYELSNTEKSYIIPLFLEPSIAAHWDLNHPATQAMFLAVSQKLEEILLREGPTL